jgi:hypothetical protein
VFVKREERTRWRRMRRTRRRMRRIVPTGDWRFSALSCA